MTDENEEWETVLKIERASFWVGFSVGIVFTIFVTVIVWTLL